MQIDKYTGKKLRSVKNAPEFFLLCRSIQLGIEFFEYILCDIFLRRGYLFKRTGVIGHCLRYGIGNRAEHFRRMLTDKLLHHADIHP